MSQLLTSWGQSIRASASESVLPMNFQGWSPLGLTGLISLLSKGLLKSLLQHHSLKVPIFWCSTFFWPNSYLYITIGKTIALTIQTFASKVMSLLFNTPLSLILLQPHWALFFFPSCTKLCSHHEPFALATLWLEHSFPRSLCIWLHHLSSLSLNVTFSEMPSLTSDHRYYLSSY